MKISELIDRLRETRELHGDVEVVRGDGKPFTFIVVEENTPRGWLRVVREDL